MAAATTAIYRDALASEPAPIDVKPIAPQRCLAALGYTPWYPPAAPAENPSNGAQRGALAFLARAALSIRHTPPGRVLYRLAPKPWLDALRERL
jgi:hypothetical protein